MDIDLTFFIQLGIFLFLLVVLSGTLIRPFMQVAEARHQRIHGARAEVEKLARLAEENRVAYQARLQQARAAARREREALRNAGNEEKREIVAEVRAQITHQLNQVRQEIALAEAGAGRDLATSVEALAEDVLTRMLGKQARP